MGSFVSLEFLARPQGFIPIRRGGVVEPDRAEFKFWLYCVALSLARSLPTPQFPHSLKNKHHPGVVTRIRRVGVAKLSAIAGSRAFSKCKWKSSVPPRWFGRGFALPGFT